jgi:hypothetical protein
MATTTTNYGFDVPTSSDLVKNGATAISTLGQDLDTFLFRPFTQNVAINGGTDIWQRGTSFTPSAGAITQLADRWSGIRPTVTGWTVSRKTSATDSGFTGSTYFMRVQRDSGNTATQDLNIAYNNLEGESFIPLQGQSVTISFYAKAGANYSSASSILNIAAVTGTTADTATWSVSGTTNSTTKTLTTSWQRFTYTFTFGATDKAMRTQFYYTPVGTAGANDFFDIWGLQIEVGTQATPFTRAGGTIQGELAACQRYYYAHSVGSNVNVGLSNYTLSSELHTAVQFPVTMRTAPSLDQVTGTNYYAAFTAGVTDTFDALIISRASATSTQLYQTGATISGTAGTSGILYTNNAATRLAFTAEL